jgi:hypothetical protein
VQRWPAFKGDRSELRRALQDGLEGSISSIPETMRTSATGPVLELQELRDFVNAHVDRIDGICERFFRAFDRDIRLDA